MDSWIGNGHGALDLSTVALSPVISNTVTAAADIQIAVWITFPLLPLISVPVESLPSTVVFAAVIRRGVVTVISACRCRCCW